MLITCAFEQIPFQIHQFVMQINFPYLTENTVCHILAALFRILCFTSATFLKYWMCRCKIFFYLCLAQKEGGMIPIFDPNVPDAASYINPLPHCLMLTAIVVSLGTTGVAIALLMRIKEVYGSVEEVEVIRRASK